jgi:hypothetical protein
MSVTAVTAASFVSAELRQLTPALIKSRVAEVTIPGELLVTSTYELLKDAAGRSLN